jgi:N-acetylmuramoyl-L-alanine amidase
MLRLSVIARFKLLICLMIAGSLSPLALAQAKGPWEIVKLHNREYVTVDSVKTFYNFTKLTRTGSSIKLENSKVHILMKIGSQECIMNGVKFVFSFPVESSGAKAVVSRTDLAKLIDPVLRPNYIQNAGTFNTVILDPGHGGKDPGATNSISNEATYTLSVATKLKTMLQAKGFRVVMTRETDTYLSLQQRVNIANSVKGNAIYISIHFNSGGRAARGIETFALSPQGVAHYGKGLKSSDFGTVNGNQHDSANIALATSIQGCVLRRLGNHSFDRGIKRARWSVLSGVMHPAILVECGFVTHPYEARLIENETYRNAVAAGLHDAVLKYRNAVGRKTAP